MGAWLEHRRRPDTPNPHLLINKQTALETGPISGASTSAALRGQTVTLERLHVIASSKKHSATAPTRSTSPRCSESTRRPRSLRELRTPAP
ncbi:hypothetical protein ACFVDQ_18570 [Streptomyces sp. NPDC057684]|uniref:hypothetical protein n=1 Tax=Streptomyces sp. NPDC057684 TaxID=3346211 RepID=UPI003691411F